MIRGIYTAAAGMAAAQLRQDIITNNLANADTPGFKRDGIVQGEFPRIFLSRYDGDEEQPLGSLGLGSRVDDQYTDFGQGTLRETGNPLDVAIVGDGFFAVQTPAGQRYTRQGHFVLDGQGFLTTPSGNRIMGQEGPIQVQRGSRIVIDGQGNLLQDGQYLDTLQIVNFNEPSRLAKEGNGLLDGQGMVPEAMASPRLQPGYLEGSNVNLIREMTGMIEAVRYYQLNQRLISLQDQTLDKAVNQVGRLS
ncbi:MAG: flagellar basal-body rod protein FlgF [Halanaerobium sp.]|nr:flagellar basal-body rod protein FlgF [Halanaerobium sp.]